MEEEILKDAKEISESLEEIDEETKKSKKLWLVIAIFLVALMFFWYIPSYAIKLDPAPRSIPSIDDVVPKNLEVELGNGTVRTKYDFFKYMQPNDPVVKRTADLIITKSECLSNKICHAKAMFYFVRDNFNYVSDPTAFEFVKSAKESLLTRGGDCDDGSVLLSSLLGAVGIRTRLVFVPRHVYVQAYLPEALNRYKQDNWVNLDVTCTYCSFGEIPFKYKDVKKDYVE